MNLLASLVAQTKDFACNVGDPGLIHGFSFIFLTRHLKWMKCMKQL